MRTRLDCDKYVVNMCVKIKMSKKAMSVPTTTGPVSTIVPNIESGIITAMTTEARGPVIHNIFLVAGGV